MSEYTECQTQKQGAWNPRREIVKHLKATLKIKFIESGFGFDESDTILNRMFFKDDEEIRKLVEETTRYSMTVC